MDRLLPNKKGQVMPCTMIVCMVLVVILIAICMAL